MAQIAPRYAAATVVLALALSACSRTEPAQDINVGAIRFSVNVPKDAEVLAEGDDVVIRQLTAQPTLLHDLPAITLRDLGPVTPEGLHREMSRLQKDWHEGRVAQVQARMKKSLLLVRFALQVPFDLGDFHEAWRKLLTAPPATPYDVVAPNFATILGMLDQTLSPEVSAIADSMLPWVEPRNRREIVSRKTMSIDKREAIELETRDQMHGNGPRRLLFVVNEGCLLVMTSGYYDQDKNLPGYETVRSSIRFPKGEGKK